MLVLIVTPVGLSTRGQLFDGAVDGRTIVRGSAAPMLDAARVLKEAGVDPATLIVMRHAGRGVDAMRSTIGTAAGLAVYNDTGGKPVLRGWRASPFRGPSAVTGEAKTGGGRPGRYQTPDGGLHASTA